MDEDKYSSAVPPAARVPALQLQPVANLSNGRTLEDKDPLPVKSSQGAHPKIDGGGGAWLQVAGSFMLILNTWGFINTYGQLTCLFSPHER